MAASRSTLFVGGIVALGAAVALQPAPVQAQTPAPTESVSEGTGAQPGDIVIELRGGKVADNLAAVLDALIGVPEALPTVSATLGEHSGICELLAARGYPPGCDALMKPVRRLNPGLDDRALSATSQITLPVIAPTRLNAIRALSGEQAKSAASGEGFKWSTDRLLQRIRGNPLLRYTAYQLLVPTRDDSHAGLILDALRARQLLNVEFELAARKPPPPRAFALGQQTTAACDAALLDYTTLLDGDLSLAALTRLPANAPGADVWIIDTALSPTPDLPDENGVSVPAPQGCTQTAFNRPLHHATHLAGIIASRNDVRFRGLAPGARVHSIPYLKPDPDDPRKYAFVDNSPRFALRRDLESAILRSDRTVPVFLVATSFLAEAREVEAVRQSRDNRVQVPPNSVFFNHPSLVIASAGQQAQRPDGSFDPADLPLDKVASNYPDSPQNLGDLPNVVLVTACSVCSRAETHLMPGAYRPLRDTRSTIALIAPAGPVAGWVSQSEISQAAGTSQAAAYVAGVVAGMLARYDRLDAWKIKYWLMATAWPLVDNGRHDIATIEAVGGGLVDPLRAWLDPSKHWVKMRGGGWQSIRLRRWSGKALDVVFRDESSGIVATPSIAHIVRVSDPGVQQREFALLTFEKYPSEFKRWGPLRFDSSLALERCDGSDPIALEDIDELIFAIPRLSERPDACR